MVEFESGDLLQSVCDLIAFEQWSISNSSDIVEVEFSECCYEAVDGEVFHSELLLHDFQDCHGLEADEEVRFDALAALQIYR